MTSSAPAICGTRLGLTKLTASIRGSPAAASRSHELARAPAASAAPRSAGRRAGRRRRSRSGASYDALLAQRASSSSERPSSPPKISPLCAHLPTAPVQRTRAGRVARASGTTPGASDVPISGSSCSTSVSRARQCGSSKMSAIGVDRAAHHARLVEDRSISAAVALRRPRRDHRRRARPGARRGAVWSRSAGRRRARARPSPRTAAGRRVRVGGDHHPACRRRDW